MDFNRLTKREYVGLLALTASMRSEDPFTNVGAALLDTEGKVLGTGYNGLLAKMEVPEWMKREEYRAKKSALFIHAEENLFRNMKPGIPWILGLTISPCPVCSKLIAGYGVKEVLYFHEYEKATSDFRPVLDFYGVKYRRFNSIEVSHIYNATVDIRDRLAGIPVPIYEHTNQIP